MENRTFAASGSGTSATATASSTAPAPVAVPEQGRGAPRTPGRALGARRRRPAVLAMAVALIAAGGLGGAVLYNSTGQRITVLALARDVPWGQTLTEGDLVTVRIASDPALKPLDAADRAKAIGMRATTDLHRGGLLTKSDLAQSLVLSPGQLLVGVAARRTQLPATRLQPGLPVIVVYTSDGGRSETLAATVFNAGRADSDGSQVFDVVVNEADAAKLAGWVATGRIQVVLAPRPSAASPGATAPGTPAPGATGTPAAGAPTSGAAAPAAVSGASAGTPAAGTPAGAPATGRPAASGAPTGAGGN
ncbi:SAF domain-containing protein [Kitasatospora purpeofusca]|uniref:SAF domain-containing protein n=1 Tax=Kitasatospora purpeofusca TaxID=67352 RepID=UPI00225C0563|nr:SAF domain-containing protein [Kitasatospora purpeofusca]MCX4689109.1 SAF domain-containing protein [Kitasatospora purpeofusca]